MAITTTPIVIIVRGVYLAQRVEVIQWYDAVGAAFLTADAAGVAEAYWNDIKVSWRACHVATALDLTQSVFVAEDGVSGAYGEYAVPDVEQQGTRPDSGVGHYLPPYVTTALRLTVASRTTRPGQKRFWGVMEADNIAGVLQPTLAALVETLAAKFDSVITLGVPVATGTLTPVVTHKDPTTHLVTGYQPVIGHVLSPYLSTQNSRKIGRGV